MINPKYIQPLLTNSIDNNMPFGVFLDSNTLAGIANFDISSRTNDGNRPLFTNYKGCLINIIGHLGYLESEFISEDGETLTLIIKDQLGNNIPDGTLVRALIFGE